MWRRYCCLRSFFPIVDTCLSCEDIARQSCAMVPRWRFFREILRPVFSASRIQHISDLRLKFALRPHHKLMCGSVNILSATADIRRGKKERKKEQEEEQTTGQKYNAPLLHRAAIRSTYNSAVCHIRCINKVYRHTILDVCYTHIKGWNSIYLVKIIPMLPLLSIARVRTTWPPHVKTFFQNKIFTRWSIMYAMGKVWQ